MLTEEDEQGLHAWPAGAWSSTRMHQPNRLAPVRGSVWLGGFGELFSGSNFTAKEPQLWALTILSVYTSCITVYYLGNHLPYRVQFTLLLVTQAYLGIPVPEAPWGCATGSPAPHSCSFCSALCKRP